MIQSLVLQQWNMKVPSICWIRINWNQFAVWQMTSSSLQLTITRNVKWKCEKCNKPECQPIRDYHEKWLERLAKRFHHNIFCIKVMGKNPVCKNHHRYAIGWSKPDGYGRSSTFAMKRTNQKLIRRFHLQGTKARYQSAGEIQSHRWYREMIRIVSSRPNKKAIGREKPPL